MPDHSLPPRGTPDVWERIAECGSTAPLIMYGTGDGADKILDIFLDRGISISGVFASDGFVRKRSFRGFPVISYDEMTRKYPSAAVILAFGSSRPEVLDNISRISRERVLFCPDIPVAGCASDGARLFDREYYSENYDKFASLYESLADDESRRILSLIIRYKLTGDVSYLFNAVSGDGIYDETLNGFIRLSTVTEYADIGAYSGDTLRSAIASMSSLSSVIALEPDPRAYKKLSLYAAYAASANLSIHTINAAAWDSDTTLDFISGGGRGSSASASKTHAGEKNVTVNAVRLDGILPRSIDFIKYDVEGAEARALLGTSKIISENAPRLLVSAYHKTEDLLSLPSLILSLQPDYKLYLRRLSGVPAWDINLYAVI